MEFENSGNSLFVVHQNIRSFNANGDEFLLFLSQINKCVDILIFTETWFSPLNVDNILGYRDFHCYRTERLGGGVSVFVRKELKVKINFRKSKIEDCLEYCLLDLCYNNGFIVSILAVYRPPNNQLTDACEELRLLIEEIKRNNLIFLCGDVNVDLLNPDESECQFIDLLLSSTFSPLIDLPTRVTDTSHKCIDHIWTNSLGKFESGIITHNITDHYSIFVECPVVPERELVTIKYHDCSPRRLLDFESKLNEFCQNFFLYNSVDVGMRTKVFCDKISELYKTCCPVVTKSISYSRFNKPWLTEENLDLINRKHKLFKLYKRGVVSYVTYNRMNLHVSSVLKRDKRNYYRNKFAMVKCNSGKTWRLINDCMGGAGGREDVVLDVDGRGVFDSGDVANEFNNYFTSVALDLDALIPLANRCPMDFMQPRLPHTFFAPPTNVGEISEILGQVPNKRTYLNNVPPFIYKKFAHIISPIIANLFNESLLYGIFPSCLKCGRVIPLHKKGIRNIISNYRPITTLPFLSKIFERLMHSRLFSFFKKFDVLCNQQFGFRKGRSTTGALLEYVNEAYEYQSEQLFFHHFPRLQSCF